MKQKRKISSRRAKIYKKRNRKAILSFLIFALTIFSIAGILQLPFWFIQSVNIESSPYNAKFAKVFVKEAQIKGTHLLMFNPESTRQNVLHNLLLEDVQIERYLWPARVDIHMTDRIPLFRVYIEPKVFNEYTLDNSVLVDKKGYHLLLPKNRKPVNKVAISLEQSFNFNAIPEDRLDIAIKLNHLYKQGQLPFLGVYNLSQTNNIILNDKEIPVPIWLGTLDDLSAKLGLIKPMKEILTNQKNPVKYIDLRFWKQPVLKLK